ncbi:hypothetical protein SD71_15985 [Cohnella kolymensis]|uniref:Uncharacterized protein n=1 Tax=Cohnella kolymensis TaxID=1590652 RepID=A0ABR5A256_9BACL|nr:hypothetical protein [Cohnella kolymensis]KIL35134.1 hypothetical protein SD71_15985 [Cohnella kolymensis]
MAVDKNRLHQLFMSGMLMAGIAKELGIPNASCQSIISKERKKNPEHWPLRKSKRDKAASDSEHFMHLYECTYCVVTFAVEDYEEVDHSQTVCPICHSVEHIEDAGYGYFTKTKEAEKAG